MLSTDQYCRFKSVFKIADVVWISSCDFTFKFDKTQFLGMVTPVWEDFPAATQPGWTSIYLQLSKDFEEETLVQELLNFDVNLLIFLKHIKEIQIKVNRIGNQTWVNKVSKNETWTDGNRTIVLHTGSKTFHYRIWTNIINDLPDEPKRPNWPQTKLLLAFPTTDICEKPRLDLQNAYAFLPIRNYGLKVGEQRW